MVDSVNFGAGRTSSRTATAAQVIRREVAVALRAGGLIPIARQYPGAREFVEAHRKEFPGTQLSYHSGAGYGGPTTSSSGRC